MSGFRVATAYVPEQRGLPDMTKVRVVMHPDKEYDVGPQELLDLQRQGLLLRDLASKVDVTGTSTALPVEEK